MKKRLLAVVLPVFLLFCGCASMLDRSSVSYTPHVDYSVTEDAAILRAESYRDLINGILHFVNEQAASGTIRLYNYPGNVDDDLDRACREVLQEDPLSAFAVQLIDYDSTRILTYYEVSLNIRYRRSASTMESIRNIAGTSELLRELEQMVAERTTYTTLLASYFSGDAALVESLFQRAYLNAPDTAVHLPSAICHVSFYPETGSRRILEIKASWPGHNAQRLNDYTQQLQERSTQLLTDHPPKADAYTVEELADLVRTACPAYDPQGSGNAAGPLSGTPSNDTGLLLAMEYLCHQAGIDATMVIASSGDAPMWLIVSTPDGYRHLLPQSLRPAESSDTDTPEPAEPLEPAFALYTDQELAALGYGWLDWLYPACTGTSAEPTE